MAFGNPRFSVFRRAGLETLNASVSRLQACVQLIGWMGEVDGQVVLAWEIDQICLLFLPGNLAKEAIAPGEGSQVAP